MNKNHQIDVIQLSTFNPNISKIFNILKDSHKVRLDQILKLPFAKFTGCLVHKSSGTWIQTNLIIHKRLKRQEKSLFFPTLC